MIFLFIPPELHLISFIFFTIIAAITFWIAIAYITHKRKVYEEIIAVITFISFILFCFTLNTFHFPYSSKAWFYSYGGYSPISYRHSAFLFFFHAASFTSLLKVYFKGHQLPPIQLSLFVSFISIGIISNVIFLYHILFYKFHGLSITTLIEMPNIFFALYPTLITIISIVLIIKLIKQKAQLNLKITYKNKWLNILNERLIKINNLPFISIFFSLPILVFITLILMLFGQDPDSLTKVFTETANWNLSSHTKETIAGAVSKGGGHYLCTVAAHGTPKIVKPIGLGSRNGNPIIVNRQLQIANAFEYMVEQISPTVHCIIRTNYDKYGFDLSKTINSERMSNLTYILMKPFEWIFLFCLYSFYVHPEQIISKQYT